MLEVLAELGAGAAKLAAAPLWTVPDAELPDALVAAQRLERCAAALTAHLVRQIDSRGIAAAQDRRGVPSWVRSRLQLDPHAARALTDLSAALDRHDAVDRAFSAGDLSAAQATAILAALDALPPDVGRDTTVQAEAALVGWSAELEPSKLRRLGGRILDHVAPERADEADAAALRREEQRARQRRGLFLSAPFEGLVRVSGHLTVGDAAVVRAALDPLCAPRPGDERTPAQLRADALTDICRLALRAGDLPDSGGEPPQVAVTMTLDALTGRVGRARLDTGESLTAGAARRIACDARVVPMVLGGAGQILDAGRARRVASGSLRRALVARDQCCAFPGCDRPPRWCDAHHVRHWADGGATDLDNLVLLCGHHHQVVHEGDWQIQMGTDRRPDFVPPAYVDSQRRARRNMFHRRT